MSEYGLCGGSHDLWISKLVVWMVHGASIRDVGLWSCGVPITAEWLLRGR